MRIALAGATGFIGEPLVLRLRERGASLSVFTRDTAKSSGMFPGVRAVRWDPVAALGPKPEDLSGIDAVVNLAGSTVAQRWSARVKQQIAESRILSTRLLVDAILKASNGPKVLVNASAIGFYGPRQDETLDESAASGKDFLSEVCRQWEAEAAKAAAAGVRVSMMRTGIVLGAGGGALAQMLFPFKMGAGGPIGSGRQWMSWIHIDDVVGLIIHALNNASVAGPLNTTAPEPVTNKDFASTLGRVLHRPVFLPTPPSALKMLFGEFADILAAGQRVVPAKALATGYAFRYPQLEGALRQILQ